MDERLRRSRRRFLSQGGLAFGWMALQASGLGGRLPLPTRKGGRAKSVIYLHMEGSPPTMDMFDSKPLLTELNGRPCPDELFQKERFAFIKGHPKILGAPHPIRRCGESGAWVIDLMPRMQQAVDRFCFVKSMYTEQFNHAPAQFLLQTGSPRIGRPCMGSWIHYGLGSLNEELPAFVVLISGGNLPSSGKSIWGNGFLPSIHQGVQFRSAADPVLFLADPPGVDREGRRRTIELLREFDGRAADRSGDPETRTRIEQAELAFRMQVSVPEAADLAGESRETLDLYGAEPGKPSLAANCLLARRLVERGVRFVQLYDAGWDIHGTGPGDDLMTQFPRKCGQLDRALSGLVLDLERRGLLDETLVVWGGEFGRTPMNEERNGSKFLGRDHHPHCFTILMAGGGIRQGLVHGATDDLAWRVAEKPVHVHDLQATILHQLGIDHEKLVYRYQGRDFRLTDVAGRVVTDLIA